MARRPTVQFDWKKSALSSDFGLDWATKLFGEEAIASLPILKSGPNKGKPKGFVHWRKAINGGWVGFPVKAGQLVDAWIGEFEGSSREHAMTGQWMGRLQSLAGSSAMLFQEARDREAKQQIRSKAEMIESSADYHAENGRTEQSDAKYAEAIVLWESIGETARANAVRKLMTKVI